MFQFSLGEGKANDITTYDAIIKSIDRQLQRDSELRDKRKFFLFRVITYHRTIQLSKYSYGLLFIWEDGNSTWEHVSVMRWDYPIYLAKYERENKILNNPGGNQLRLYVNNNSNMKLLLEAHKDKKIRNTARIKFVMNIPCNNKEVMMFDVKNGNTTGRMLISLN